MGPTGFRLRPWSLRGSASACGDTRGVGPVGEDDTLARPIGKGVVCVLLDTHPFSFHWTAYGQQL